MVGHTSNILTDGQIYSVIEGGDGSVYVAGRFNTINNFSAKGVAKWDGSNWSGFGSTNFASAVAADKAGNVYIAVDSSDSSGGPMQLIKKWDGSRWTRLGNTGSLYMGHNQTRLSIGKDGSLFVLADRYYYPSVTHDVASIAKWDGKAWFALDSGTADPWSPAVVMDSADHIYIGTENTSFGTPLSKGIAFWDGSAWTNFETHLDRYGRVTALAWDKSGTLYAGGTFDSIGGIQAHHLARWSGGAWTRMGAGTSGSISGLTSDGSGTLYATGTFDTIDGVVAHNIARWSGERWTALGTGARASVVFAAMGNGTLYAGGEFDTIGGIAAKSIALWNGSSWKALPAGSTGADIFGGSVHACVVDGKKNLYVGGEFTRAGGLPAKLIARWNGVSWDSLGRGLSGPYGNGPIMVTSLAVDGMGSLYAGGTFSRAGTDSTPGLARWDGSRWNPIAPDLFGSVQALSLDRSGYVVAGGQFLIGNRYDLWNIALWDGSAWRSLGGGINNVSGNGPTVSAMFRSLNGDLMVGGNFEKAGAAAAKNIASWNGSQWNAIGPTYQDGHIDGLVRAITEDPAGNLYVGGSFKLYGDTNTINLARWNGTAWTVFARRLNGNVLSLACDNDGALYVGGAFTQVGALPANHIVKWDGIGWDSLGTGLDGDVQCFAWSDSALIVGGRFTTAGGKLSPNLAMVRVDHPGVGVKGPLSPIPAAADFQCRRLNSSLRISGLHPEDVVSIHSINGDLLYQARGTPRIDLKGFGPQPLIVRIARSSDIGFVQFVPMPE